MQAEAQLPQTVHFLRFREWKKGTLLRPSGLWHHSQLIGQPFQKTEVRIPARRVPKNAEYQKSFLGSFRAPTV